MAAVGATLLLLFWKGCVCQLCLGYEVVAPKRVTVQEGLCVSIPCTFTYPGYQTLSATPHGYWCRDINGIQFIPVTAVNNPNTPRVSQEAIERFQLMGDLQKNDCSLRINGAKRQDDGTYFFRIDDTFKFSFKNIMTILTVKNLTEKPAIFLPDVLVEGSKATASCTVPGRCSGAPPKITWREMLSTETSQTETSIKRADGTQAHTSTMTFIPSRRDHNTSLTCEVLFPIVGISTQKTVLLHIQKSVEETNISSPQDCGKVGTGFIIGIVIGNLVLLALIALASFCFAKKIKKTEEARKNQSSEVNTKGKSNDTEAGNMYQVLSKQTSEIYENLEGAKK